MEENLNYLNNDFYSTKTMAWELYYNNDNKPLSSQLLGFGPIDDGDELTYRFELLLDIFVQMLLIMLEEELIKEKEENSEDLESDNITAEINFNYFDMDLFYPEIRNKFKKISYLLTIETYDRNDDKEYLFLVAKDRYNRIILKNNPEDNHYFKDLDNNVYHEFIPSQGFEPKNKLKDIYAIMNINSKMYKIKFDTIEKIPQNLIK